MTLLRHIFNYLSTFVLLAGLLWLIAWLGIAVMHLTGICEFSDKGVTQCDQWWRVGTYLYNFAYLGGVPMVLSVILAILYRLYASRHEVEEEVKVYNQDHE